jgi:hypothetical protein
MSSIFSLSSQQLRHIADLKEKIDSLQVELSRLIQRGGPKRKFRMSTSGRARIAAAQRARWAKARKAKAAGKKRL